MLPTSTFSFELCRRAVLACNSSLWISELFASYIMFYLCYIRQYTVPSVYITACDTPIPIRNWCEYQSISSCSSARPTRSSARPMRWVHVVGVGGGLDASIVWKHILNYPKIETTFLVYFKHYMSSEKEHFCHLCNFFRCFNGFTRYSLFFTPDKNKIPFCKNFMCEHKIFGCIRKILFWIFLHLKIRFLRIFIIDASTTYEPLCRKVFFWLLGSSDHFVFKC
jgi:hypothetical protein